MTYTPPRRIIEPLKLALAIAIIYAIAFYMGWDKPYWATVSAVSVNLLSTGLTLHRGVIRTIGTLMGGLLGMIAIGIFPQERWAYLILLSVVLFYLGYKATGKKEPYLYLIILITFIVIMAVVQQSDYSDSGHAFEVTMLRVSQTGMGSLVMILIMVYVFPYRTIDEFEDLARARWGIQRELQKAYRGMLFGQEAAADTKHLRMEDAPLLDYCHFKLHGAEQDSFEMMVVGHDWHHYLDLSAEQYEYLEALRQSLSEARDLDLTTYLPNLAEVCDELDRRFEQTERMLDKKAPTEIPHHITIAFDETALRTLPHFQRAAVLVIKSQLEKLEAVSLSLYDCVARIRSFHEAEGAHDDHHGHGAAGFKLSLDPFRLQTTAAFVLAVIVSFLLWVYVYDMPRGSLYPCFVVITASIMAYRPEMNPLTYSSAWLVGGLAAGPCYVLIMQHLSGHLQFSIMVIVGVFLLQYILYPRMHPVPRIFSTIGFTIVIDAENHQHYDFVHYVQTMLWMAVALATMLILRFALVPRRPDVMFMRTLDQFFRHADFLLSEHDAEGRPDKSLWRRIKSVFYGHSVLVEAERLALFAGQISPVTGKTTYRMLRETSPEQIQELVRAVYAIGHRIEALMEARRAWRSNKVDDHMLQQKREWLNALQEWFRRPPGKGVPTGDLAALQADFERRIDEAFARIGEEEMEDADYEDFYGRLGSYRGLSEAVREFTRVASTFDWPRWRETRF